MCAEALSDGVPSSLQAGFLGESPGEWLRKTAAVDNVAQTITSHNRLHQLTVPLRSYQTCVSRTMGKWRLAARQPWSQGSHFRVSALPLVECGKSREEGPAQMQLVHGWHWGASFILRGYRFLFFLLFPRRHSGY